MWTEYKSEWDRKKYNFWVGSIIEGEWMGMEKMGKLSLIGIDEIFNERQGEV